MSLRSDLGISLREDQLQIFKSPIPASHLQSFRPAPYKHFGMILRRRRGSYYGYSDVHDGGTGEGCR